MKMLATLKLARMEVWITTGFSRLATEIPRLA